MKITDIVKNSIAEFSYYRNGYMYYDVYEQEHRNYVCTFPVDIANKEDIGQATFEAEHKAITLMRYIRKAIKDETITYVKVGER